MRVCGLKFKASGIGPRVQDFVRCAKTTTQRSAFGLKDISGLFLG